jgi:valyl-tRNA synthetase
MPVQFECPACQQLIDQTQKNRVLPRVKCPACGKEFSTQWAEKPDDVALPRGAVVSERFELARNFTNKLWNAARFALMNLEGYVPGEVRDEDLTLEDRWLLSRLATVTDGVTEALAQYRFAEAARQLYDFAWDEFCSFYVEMVKSRLAAEAQSAARATAQRVLAHALDNLLRLLHPFTPFLTEEIWQRLGEAAPRRGLTDPQPSAESAMIAPWPQADATRRDATIEARFARFQEVLKGLREVRHRQNVPPKTRIAFAVRCDDEAAELLRPMAPYFESMAGATATEFGPTTQPPALAGHVNLSGIDLYVDLAGLIDVAAEISKTERELVKLVEFIAAKEKKLANESFAARAPADVVQKERDSLDELRGRQTAAEEYLARMRSTK